MSNIRPHRVSSPGAILREELECREWSQRSFAKIIGRPVQLVNEIVLGKRAITPDVALDLEAALDIDAIQWLRMEAAYRLRKTEDARTRADAFQSIRERARLAA